MTIVRRPFLQVEIRVLLPKKNGEHAALAIRFALQAGTVREVSPIATINSLLPFPMDHSMVPGRIRAGLG